MKILAFSDLHRDVEAARRIVEVSSGADVVVGAGDFATCGEGAKDTLDILQGIRVPWFLSLETRIARMSSELSARIGIQDTCSMATWLSFKVSRSFVSAAKPLGERRSPGIQR